MGRVATFDHNGRHGSAGRGLKGCFPALVDLHQVDQRTDDAVDAVEEFFATGPLQVLERALQRFGPSRRAMPGLLGPISAALQVVHRGRGLGRWRPRRPGQRHASGWPQSTSAWSGVRALLPLRPSQRRAGGGR